MPRPDRARRAGTCARWRPTGAIPPRSPARRERSFRPSAVLAAATMAQLVSLREICSRNGRMSRRGRLQHGADQLGRLPLQQIGIVRADRQHGVTGRHVFGERFRQPRRKIAERVARRVLEPQRLLRFVAVNRFDERRAGAIRRCGNLTRQRRRFERCAAIRERSDNHQPLPRLQVQRNPHGELRINLQLSIESIQRILNRLLQSRERLRHTAREPRSGRAVHVVLEQTTCASYSAVHQPSGDVGLLHVEIAIQDDEIGDGALGDEAGVCEAELGRRCGRAELRGVVQGEADIVNQKPKHAIHRRHAAGERAVFEIGRGSSARESCGRRATPCDPSGRPAAATPSVIAIMRAAPLAAIAIRTMSRCTCTPSQMISAATSSLVRIAPASPGSRWPSGGIRLNR